jgi:hypothetical protein
MPRTVGAVSAGVVAKAEHFEGKENPRFMVTSLAAENWPARELYERLYCARGGMENRIKKQFQLFVDRVSSETMCVNQLSAVFHILVSGLRRLGLKANELAQAQPSTIRTKLFKIGATVRVNVRRVWVSMASNYPWQKVFQRTWMNVRC